MADTNMTDAQWFERNVQPFMPGPDREWEDLSDNERQDIVTQRKNTNHTGD